jgi:hypothetical protein
LGQISAPVEGVVEVAGPGSAAALARPGGWASAAGQLSSARAVGEFPEDIEVAVVPGSLLGQVEQDPAQHDRLSPPTQGAPGGSVQGQGRRQVAVPRAGSPVLSQQLGERYLDRDPELAIGIIGC